MAKYCFPAKFTPEEKGFSVIFRDLEGCYTCGESLEDAIEMAEDVLALCLTDYEDEHREIPKPMADIPLKEGEFINWIRADTVEYRKLISPKAVKKTVTIPQWLNTLAEKADINFSQTLQEAIKSKLAIA